MSMTRRIILFLWIVAFVLLAAPVEACGCGIYVPREGAAKVSQERALLRWDGHTEDIVMALSVQGSSQDAAWILPVPSRATVKLADMKLFDALQELTKPRVEKRFALLPPLSLGAGAAPGAGAPVTLLSRQALGPFDVSTLAASDANALSAWLKTNGYAYPDGLNTVLKSYVEKNWFYVAARLTPGAGDTLKGNLDPLWVTFESSELIYPMRASALARSSLGVSLYVLADHRVTKPTEFGSAHVGFADWVEPPRAADSPLAPFITRKLFLTKTQEQIFDPARINSDFVFAFAPQDDVYHDVIYENEYAFAGIPNLLWLCLLACVLPGTLLLVGTFVWARRRTRLATAGGARPA